MHRTRLTLLGLVLAAPTAVFAAPRHQRPVPPSTTAKSSAASSSPAHTNSTVDFDSALPSINAHTEGEYGGIDPEHPEASKNEPSHGKPKKPPPKGTLAWIGFEGKDGGADVFFQSVAPFDLAQHVENGVLVVELSGLDRLGQNTWRPIDAHYFDSPIARIAARRVGAARASKTGPGHGAGIEVRISFKDTKDAREGATRSATEADGLYYSYLSFGGGSGSGNAAPDPAPDPAPAK